MAKTTKKDKGPAEEVKLDAKGTYSLTLYYFAVVEGKAYPAQQTLTCESAEDFTRMLPELYAALVPAEGDFVTYEPRNIGPASAAAGSGGKSSGGGRGRSGQQGQERVLGPECPFHKEPTTQKKGRNGLFFSCSKRRDNGDWCNWTPEEDED